MSERDWGGERAPRYVPMKSLRDVLQPLRGSDGRIHLADDRGDFTLEDPGFRGERGIDHDELLDERRAWGPEAVAEARARIEAMPAHLESRKATLADQLRTLEHMERVNAIRTERADLCPGTFRAEDGLRLGYRGSCLGIGALGRDVIYWHPGKLADPELRTVARAYCACPAGEARRALDAALVEQVHVEIKAAYFGRIWEKQGIAGDFRTYTLGSWVSAVANKEPGAKDAALMVTRLLKRWEATDDWLYFSGPPGRGKTALLLILLARLATDRAVLFRTGPQLLDEIRGTFDPESQSSPRQLTRHLAEVPILAIDDLDKVHPTGWVRERLYDLIDHRYVARRRTLLTANLGLASPELATLLHEATASRIEARCGATGIIALNGPNLR